MDYINELQVQDQSPIVVRLTLVLLPRQHTFLRPHTPKHCFSLFVSQRTEIDSFPLKFQWPLPLCL